MAARFADKGEIFDEEKYLAVEVDSLTVYFAQPIRPAGDTVKLDFRKVLWMTMFEIQGLIPA